MKKLIKDLCNLDGVSGREQAVREYIINALKNAPVKTEIHIDPLGNILCHVFGEKTANKKLLFAAHMDEVGVIVTHISEDGYLHFSTVGGISPSALYGKRVRFPTTKGIIGCKAIHLCNKEEADKIAKTEEMYIDIGVSSAKEAKELVQIGDVAVFDTDFDEMQDLLTGKALDDRIGCALLLQLVQEIPEHDFYLAFTVQEEVGLRGAGPAAFTINPDVAVIVDCTTAADIINTPPEKQVCKVGEGAVVSFMDKATLYDAELYSFIRHLADQAGIPNQTKNVIAGGNDAGSIQKSRGGVKVAAVSLPCRYIHSAAGAVHIQDIQSTRALLLLLKEELIQ